MRFFIWPRARRPARQPRRARRRRKLSAASGVDGYTRKRFAPAPQEERPGLGTRWGETRESQVRATSFRRANGSRPFATAAIHYNDAAGHSRHDRRADAPQRTRPVPRRSRPANCSRSSCATEAGVAAGGGGRVALVRHRRKRERVTRSWCAIGADFRWRSSSRWMGSTCSMGGRRRMRKRGYIVPPHGTRAGGGFPAKHGRGGGLPFQLGEPNRTRTENTERRETWA